MAKFTLSIDDGCASDVRVAKLATRYGIETVFYWPVEHRSLAYDNGYEPLSDDQATYIIDKGFEVGSHTLTHRHLTKLTLDEAKDEILDSQVILENIFEVVITKFCPPRGYTTPELTKFTLQCYESQRLTKGPGLVHIHPNSGANGNVAWRDYYRMVKERGENDGKIELWGHSWEFDKFDLWDEIEEFFKEEA